MKTVTVKKSTGQKQIFYNLLQVGFTPAEAAEAVKAKQGALQWVSLERIGAIYMSDPGIAASLALADWKPFLPLKTGFDVKKNYKIMAKECTRTSPHALVEYLSIKRVAFCHLIVRGYRTTSAAMLCGMGNNKRSWQDAGYAQKHDMTIKDYVSHLLWVREEEQKLLT